MVHVEATIFERPVPKLLIDRLTHAMSARLGNVMWKRIVQEYGVLPVRRYGPRPPESGSATEPLQDIALQTLNNKRRQIGIRIHPGQLLDAVDGTTHLIETRADILVNDPTREQNTPMPYVLTCEYPTMYLIAPGEKLQPSLPSGEYCIGILALRT